MNQLNVHLQHSLLTLAAKGWSARRIARELGIDREPVGRRLRLKRQAAGEAKPANLPAGLDTPCAAAVLSCDTWRRVTRTGWKLPDWGGNRSAFSLSHRGPAGVVLVSPDPLPERRQTLFERAKRGRSR